MPNQRRPFDWGTTRVSANPSKKATMASSRGFCRFSISKASDSSDGRFFSSLKLSRRPVLLPLAWVAEDLVSLPDSYESLVTFKIFILFNY